jgi:purine-binding chemotaxis protein CheW
LEKERFDGQPEASLSTDVCDAAVAENQLVCFFWGEKEFGIPIQQVKETLALRPITRVFLTPPHVLGVVNLRGDILAVLDLAQLGGLPPLAFRPSSKIVVVQARKRMWGVLVDEMTGVRACHDSSFVESSSVLPQTQPWVAGVLTGGLRPVAVLDMEALLCSEPLRALTGGQEEMQ